MHLLTTRRLLSALFFLLFTSATLTTAQDYGAEFVFKCTRPGIVALTFDDGPSENTDRLLDSLAKAGIKATLFVVGNSISNVGDSGLKRAYSEGHQIGLHTTTHPHLNDLTAAQQTSEMEIVQKLVYNSLNVTPNYMRPPFGECQDTCRQTMQDLGYTVTQWNVDSNDWRYINDTSTQYELTNGIVDQLSSDGKDSYIVLQHEIDRFSVAQVPAIISAIAAKGYQFVTIAECNGNNPPPYRETPADNDTANANSADSNSINFTNSTNSTSSAAGASSSAKSSPSASFGSTPTQDSMAITLLEMNNFGTLGMALLAGVVLFSVVQ